MTKLHRDIAVRLLECVKDDEFTDQATIKVKRRGGLIIFRNSKEVEWADRPASD